MNTITETVITNKRQPLHDSINFTYICYSCGFPKRKREGYEEIRRRIPITKQMAKER